MSFASACKARVRAVRLALARRLRRLSQGDLLHAEGAMGWVLQAWRVAVVMAAIACAMTFGQLDSPVGWW
jgi:hypothetical protein